MTRPLKDSQEQELQNSLESVENAMAGLRAEKRKIAAELRAKQGAKDEITRELAIRKMEEQNKDLEIEVL